MTRRFGRSTSSIVEFQVDLQHTHLDERDDRCDIVRDAGYSPTFVFS